MARPYLGTGVKHPHKIDQFGKVELANDNELVKQSIAVILNTPLGTEFGREHFGSNIREVIFEPVTQIAITLLDFFIADAIAKWEKRVTLVDIKYDIPTNNPKVINCTIIYRLKQASDVDSFVFPFYRELNN